MRLRAAAAVLAVFACALMTAAPAQAAEQGRIAFVRAPHGQSDLFVMDPNGGHLRRLTRDEAIDSYPDWSPSGRRIAFVSFGRTPAGREVFVLDVASGEIAQLTDDGNEKADVAWAPSGRTLAFTRFDDDGEIVTVRADGSHLRRLTDNDLFDSEPAWSPDGRRIAYDSEGHLWVMNANGSAKREVLPPDVLAFEPDWSPDGEWIAFVGVEGDLNSGLYKVHPDGTELTRLTHTPLSEEYPSWSPDGRRIAYSLMRVDYENDLERFAVFTIRANGTGRRQLTDWRIDANRWPDWSGAFPS